MRFVLDDPAVSCAVVGVKTAAQVQENVGAADVLPIDEAEREQVAAVF